MAKKKNNSKEPTYGDMKPILERNLQTFESFYFASLMRSGEHGKQGLVDGLFGSLYGLRKEVGLEGILGSLEAQALQSISRGDGLNANYSLTDVISKNAELYFQSALNLRVKDLIPYIEDRLEIEHDENDNEEEGKNQTKAEIVEEEKYSDRPLKELLHKDAEDEEKEYGRYLLGQLRNAVMMKMVPLVYQERAKRETEIYQTRKQAGVYQEIEEELEED